MNLIKVLFMGCLISPCMYGMEKKKHLFTQIHIAHLPSIQYIDNKVEVIIAGRNEQLAKLGSLEYDRATGKLFNYTGKKIYLKKRLRNQFCDTSSEKNKEIIISVSESMALSRVIHVSEPWLDQEPYWCEKEHKYGDDYLYETIKTKSRTPKLSALFEFHGNNALEEAKKGLALCYHAALTYFARNNKARNIAFLPLGLASFAWKDAVEIAVDSISKYVEKKPYQYNSIWLCIVKGGEEIDSAELCRYYEQLLYERQQSILHNDKETNFVNNYFLTNNLTNNQPYYNFL